MQNFSSDKKFEKETSWAELNNENGQEVLKQIFTVYFPRLNDFARKIIKDEIISQDIVQDVFVKFWEIRETISETNIEAFLFRMARNKCLDYIRHIKVVANLQSDYSAAARYEELYRIDFIGDEPYILIEKELQSEIEKVIQTLPERCREVFILSRVNGLKNKEIAQKLGISIKNVERHINKALSIFKSDFANKIPLALIVLIARDLRL